MIVLSKQKLTISSLHLLLIVILSSYVFGQSLAHSAELSISKKNEVIDLRQEYWGQGNIFSLESSWLFIWNTFTHDRPNNLDNWHKVSVPGPWNKQSNEEATSESPLLPVGFGTYYKKILVPTETRKVFLHLPDMASAYELWHNGAFLGGNGSIATNKEEERADYLPRVYELSPQKGEIELFIKTSNHHYLWGGIWYAPRITDESGVHNIRELPVLKAMTSGTVLLATAVFCAFMYFSRRQEKKLLFFSLFCIAIGIRRLCLDERVLYMLGSFEWQTLQSLENITLYLMLPLFLIYFQLIFPQTTSKKLPAIGWICAAPFCFAALFFQVETYAGFNPYFQLVVLAFLPFILLNWARSLKAKLRHSRMFGLSLLVFVAAVINDMLNYSYIIRTTNLTHLGVLAFVLFQLASLISRYLNNFKAIESLSETLQEKNKALMQHDEFKDDFLANTSHELRMPLHGIAGLAKTVRQVSPDLPLDSQNKIKLIEATAVRLGNLVNDILDMSSLKHGKLDIQRHPTYLEPIIESTVHSLSPLIKDKPISLEFKVEENANIVLADEQRLQQIFYNLIGNAIKFTNEGLIKVEARYKNEQIQVLVSDSGIGMSSEQLETAMKAYEVHNDPSSNELRGSGLGLSITKMLVELHGSDLNIESKEGFGTTASFMLQVSQHTPEIVSEKNEILERAPTSTAPASILSENSLTRNALIFFADDEEVNRELVSSQLLAAGYRIETFVNGQTLLDRLKSDNESPELLLLDWMMPGKDGLEVCSEIRKQTDASNLPIIMLTAKLQIHNIVQALNAGANDYLTKPYHEQELIARVSSQISVKRLLLATIENENLKIEVARQERQKQELNLANQRLTTSLESSPDNIVLLNEDLDIVYANSGANRLIGIADSETDCTEQELPFANYISDDSIYTLKNHVNTEQSDQEFALVLQHQANEIQVTIHTTDIDQDRFISLILNEKKTSSDENTQELLSSLTQEIAENRQRMEQIESTLLRLNNQQPNEQIEQTSQVNSENTDNSEISLSPQELVVKTLRTSLISWERYTHKTKAELAEASHSWRVYIDGATAKTRTLDKYLNVATLPAKPRWRAVIKTANYVLDHCDLSNEDREELVNLVQQLTEAFS